MKKIIAKITKNQHGNYRAQLSGQATVLLGDFDYDAKVWLAAQVAKGAVVHKDSYFSAEDIKGI